MTDFDPHSYTITIKRVIEDGESLFKATIKELPDVIEYGDSYEEVYELAVDAINVLHEMASDMGHKFPDPSIDDERFSGRVTLRMPKSLHRSVAATAEVECVSLNQFLVATIAERVSSGNLYTALVGDFEKRMGSSPLTAFFSNIASIGYSGTELVTDDITNIIGDMTNITDDVNKVAVKATAATTEPMPFNIPFDASKLFAFQRS